MYSLKTLMICSGLCFFVGAFVGLLIAVLAFSDDGTMPPIDWEDVKRGGTKHD